MVSSKVHTQLMQIADEKAQAAERRNLELEREVREDEGKEGSERGVQGVRGKERSEREGRGT